MFVIFIYSWEKAKVTKIPLDGEKKLKDGPNAVYTVLAKQLREEMEESGVWSGQLMEEIVKPQGFF